MNQAADITKKLRALIKMKSKREFDPDMVQLFLEALSDYTPVEVLHGIKMCSKAKTFGIEPHDIIVHLEPSQEERDAKADERIADATAHCLRNFTEGDWDNPFLTDSDSADLAQAWTQVMAKGKDYWNDNTQMSYWAMEFKKAYKSLMNLPANVRRIQLMEAEEKEARRLQYENGGLLT